MKKITLLSLLLCLAFGIAAASTPSHIPATEVRAVWLTTNYGLDWPRNKISQEAQKRELITQLDKLKEHNFNTVFFQVRARGEVFYRSSIEPMASIIVQSSYGKQAFDPLAFAIEECHKRGLECHAWMVVYPLGTDRHVRSLGRRSAAKTHPNIVTKYKNEWFLDPGNPRTDKYLLDIINEIVSNYDVDGIHFDYIRYPDNSGRFPDSGMYRKYGQGKSLSEWRRDNITRFVVAAYDLVKKQKPWVQVSSAPLGRYRTLNNVGHGWTAFETVYQDAAKWMKMGKHDALYPMMYYKERLFYPFVDDWVQNGNSRIIVPGLGAYQMIELGWSRNDITNQIDYTRNKSVGGQAYFRTENVLSNTKGLLNSIKSYYKHPAKLPAMRWLSDSLPTPPQDVRAELSKDGKLSLSWQDGSETNSRITYNIYRSETEKLDVNNAELILAVNQKDTTFVDMPPKRDDVLYYYFVTSTDAFHNESLMSVPIAIYHSDIIK